MPFTFREMCELKQIKPGDVTDELFYDYIALRAAFLRGFRWKEEQTKTFLRDVYDAIVLKDIVQRAGIKDIELFNRIIEYLVCNPSQTFSATAISDYFLSINRKVSRDHL